MTQPFWGSQRSCLVTGCGFVGSHLVDALLENGVQVRVATRREKLHRTHPNLIAVKANLESPEDCLRVATGADLIFHAAGSVGSAGASFSEIIASIALNLRLTVNMLEAASRSGSSRVLVFGSSTAYPVLDRPIREEELWSGPVYPGYYGYGWMRRYIERFAEYVSRETRLGIAIVRPGALYGPRDNFDPLTSHFIPGLIRRAIENESPLSIWGNGQDVRDILHIRDFVRGCLLAIEKKADADPINLASGIGVNTAEVARCVMIAVGRQSHDIRFAHDRPRALNYRVLDISKARTTLGFEPKITLKDGLAELVNWYRCHAVID